MAKQLALVVGARPNFMKAAPLMAAVQAKGRLQARLIHTGQHFDANMSNVFFRQLQMAEPDLYLDIHGGSVNEQVARVILELDKEFTARRPDMVVVFGDVNSTLAASIAANKLNIPLAHVEAGLRSWDREMPEEHNRIVADVLADYLFTPSPDADENLAAAGIPAERVHRVGNIMVDCLLRFKPAAEQLAAWTAHGLTPRQYGVVTLHRPSNVDDQLALRGIVEALVEIQRSVQLVFPVHPRTRARMAEWGLLDALQGSGVMLLEPVGYLEFISLMTQSRFILTDSGGIQEESTVLGIPCLTARENTERPITIQVGGNRLVGNRPEGIIAGYRALQGGAVAPQQPELWDGHTAERIEAILYEKLS
ncbi:MAG: UDP-N-acetylglucosamine 2-epimerase (non-hydrolyzing) [Anaerolineales bacterium]|nr:UDP-N-acetylglucosamine 2-epimerase (non-hydrolyzing) [Anaerolineales bacterium]